MISNHVVIVIVNVVVNGIIHLNSEYRMTDGNKENSEAPFLVDLNSVR